MCRCKKTLNFTFAFWKVTRELNGLLQGTPNLTVEAAPGLSLAPAPGTALSLPLPLHALSLSWPRPSPPPAGC